MDNRSIKLITNDTIFNPKILSFVGAEIAKNAKQVLSSNNAGAISRIFNNAPSNWITAETRTEISILGDICISSINLTEKEKDALIEAIQQTLLHQSGCRPNENGELELNAALKNILPAPAHIPIQTFLSRLTKLAFEATCNELGEIRPEIQTLITAPIYKQLIKKFGLAKVRSQLMGGISNLISADFISNAEPTKQLQHPYGYLLSALINDVNNHSADLCTKQYTKIPCFKAGLIRYIQIRRNESNFHLPFFGFTKSEKIATATKLLRLINDEIAKTEFTKRERAAMKNKRLGALVKEYLHALPPDFFAAEKLSNSISLKPTRSLLKA